MTSPIAAKPADLPAWDAALAENQRWLRTVVYARLREREATDEVMQNVALAAIRQAEPLTNPGKVSPWLYRVAIRQCLLYRRGRGRQRDLIQRYARRQGPHTTCSDCDPLSWLISDERRQIVRRAMLELPRRDAEILLLKYGENWNYAQIAEKLGISLSAVEARLHRARRRLRKQLCSMPAFEVFS